MLQVSHIRVINSCYFITQAFSYQTTD